MEKRKTIFDYATEVLVIFGFTTIVMNLFCLIVGEEAQEVSSLFSLGGRGISVGTTFEFLGMSVLIICFRALFFTDILIKRMGIALRTVCLLSAVLGTVAVFAAVFGWFPVYMWQAWAMFFLCFGLSFALSLAVMVVKEKTENRQMEEALEKIKSKEEERDGCCH